MIRSTTPKSCRPSEKGIIPQHSQPDLTDRVDLLAARFENGRDLWSGEELHGPDADDWLSLQFAQSENAEREELGLQTMANLATIADECGIITI